MRLNLFNRVSKAAFDGISLALLNVQEAWLDPFIVWNFWDDFIL